MQVNILGKREGWGERVVIVYELTDLGRGRYEWFKMINTDLFKSSDWIE
jgi:hypothetical protein